MHSFYTRYSVRGVAYNLFTSYSTAGYKQVKCNNYVSDMTIDVGVPQGSFLRPILFLSYVKDLLDSIEKHVTELVAYVDDTNLLFVTDNIPNAKSQAESV